MDLDPAKHESVEMLVKRANTRIRRRPISVVCGFSVIEENTPVTGLFAIDPSKDLPSSFTEKSRLPYRLNTIARAPIAPVEARPDY